MAREDGRNPLQATWVGASVLQFAQRPKQQFFDLASIPTGLGKLPSPKVDAQERGLVFLQAWGQTRQNYPRNWAGTFDFVVREIIYPRQQRDILPQEISPALNASDGPPVI